MPRTTAARWLNAHIGSEQRNLNPSLRASTGVYIFTSKIIESLGDLDANGKIVPALATSRTAYNAIWILRVGENRPVADFCASHRLSNSLPATD